MIKKVCPINKKSMEDNKFPTAFAVKHKNDSVREKVLQVVCLQLFLRLY